MLENGYSLFLLRVRKNEFDFAKSLESDYIFAKQSSNQKSHLPCHILGWHFSTCQQQVRFPFSVAAEQGLISPLLSITRPLGISCIPPSLCPRSHSSMVDLSRVHDTVTGSCHRRFWSLRVPILDFRYS